MARSSVRTALTAGALLASPEVALPVALAVPGRASDGGASVTLSLLVGPLSDLL